MDNNWASWDYEEFEEPSRWVYMAGGSLLVWLGLRRWSVPAMLVTGVGAALLGRGLQRGTLSRESYGASTLEEPGAHPRTTQATAPAAGSGSGASVRDASRFRNSEVDEASDESFPASDPPSWTPVTGPGPAS